VARFSNNKTKTVP
jgi:hypothetical protein